jgi:hypothetical protein
MPRPSPHKALTLLIYRLLRKHPMQTRRQFPVRILQQMIAQLLHL